MAGEVSFNNKKRALKPVVPDILLNQTALVKWEVSRNSNYLWYNLAISLLYSRITITCMIQTL